MSFEGKLMWLNSHDRKWLNFKRPLTLSQDFRNFCDIIIQPMSILFHRPCQRIFTWRQIVHIHALQAMPQDQIPMHLINSGIQHIGLNRTPEIMKDNPVRCLCAVRYSGFFQVLRNMNLKPCLCTMGLPLYMNTKSCFIALGMPFRTLLTCLLIGISFGLFSLVASAGSLIILAFLSIYDHLRSLGSPVRIPVL